jgi:hypothetical protein
LDEKIVEAIYSWMKKELKVYSWMKKELKLHSWMKFMDAPQAKGMLRKKMDKGQRANKWRKKRRSKQYFYTSLQ